MEFGAKPAQESLVEGGGTSRRPAHSLVEFLILANDFCESYDLITECPLLPANGVADALNESR